MLVHKSYKKQFIHHKLGGIHSRTPLPPQFIQETIHTSQKNEEGFNTSHQLIHKSIYTSQIGIPQIDSFAKKTDKLRFHKLIHTTYREAGGEEEEAAGVHPRQEQEESAWWIGAELLASAMRKKPLGWIRTRAAHLRSRRGGSALAPRRGPNRSPQIVLKPTQKH
jgi:hypothetical protein